MAGQLSRLLNLVRDPMQVIADAARANPQRVVRENPEAVRQMASDFSRYVAETAPEVEHFTYRPLRRLPQESYPYDPRVESISGDEFSVRPQSSFWEDTQSSMPVVSFHNHPEGGALPSRPGLSGFLGGAGDLGVLSQNQPDSMMGIVGSPTRRGGMTLASMLTNLDLPRSDRGRDLQNLYSSAIRFPIGHSRVSSPIMEHLGLPVHSEYARERSALDPRMARAMGDLRTLDLVDRGKLRLDTNHLSNELLPLLRLSDIQTWPDEPTTKNMLDMHSKILEQLRRSGFAVPAAAGGTGVLEQLQRAETPEGYSEGGLVEDYFRRYNPRDILVEQLREP